MMSGTRYESLTLDSLYEEQIKNSGSGMNVTFSEPDDVTQGGPGRSVDLRGMNDNGHPMVGRITISWSIPIRPS